MIELYAQHHKCTDHRDRVYGLRDLVLQRKDSLVVNHSKSDLDVFLDVARLDLLDSKSTRGMACRILSVVSDGA